MKIIKHGKESTKLFVCEYCGCEFEVEKGEYWENDILLSYPAKRQYYSCCPECNRVVSLLVNQLECSLKVTGVDNGCTCACKGKDDISDRHVKGFNNKP